jgi:4-hydroxy-tetrahydrodipicolinate synthase
MALGGGYAVNVTPFREDSSFTLDVEAYLDHATWLGETGVRGVVPFGTNGEGPSVSLREKLEVLHTLFDRDLSIQIIPCVAQGNLPETLEMLMWLEDYPAEAVMVLPPYYYKPVDTEGLFRFYDAVLQATRHTIILYHIPKYAIPIPKEVVKALPVWGVKDSEGAPGYAQDLISAGKGVLLGTEDDLWHRLNLGASGLVSALANFIPERIVEIHQRVSAKDEAAGKELSKQLGQVRAMTKEYTSVALLKRLAQARHGVPLGTVRPPLVPAPVDYDPSRILEVGGVV